MIKTSSSYLTTASTLRFDGWTRVDFGARDRTGIVRKPVVFHAKVENVFGENYWLTTGNFVTVGSPRTFIASITVDL